MEIFKNNFEGQFEAEYGRQPSPEDWVTTAFKVEDKSVTLYDKVTDTQLFISE